MFLWSLSSDFSADVKSGVSNTAQFSLLFRGKSVYIFSRFATFNAMGITCSSHYFPQSLQDPLPLSTKLYKPFPRKKRSTRGAVVMQLTGEGLASSHPPRYMNELIHSVRYHYQYQCLFPAQDDSVLVYGEKLAFLVFTSAGRIEKRTRVDGHSTFTERCAFVDSRMSSELNLLKSLLKSVRSQILALVWPLIHLFRPFRTLGNSF